MIIDVLVTIALIGLLVWALCQLPIDDSFKQIIRVAGIVLAVLVVLGVLAGRPFVVPLFSRSTSVVTR